jgi:hypothetical protein
MSYQAKQRTEALIQIALQALLNEAQFDRQSAEIISMRLKLQHDVSLDPSAVCAEIEDLIEILRDRDRELLAV